MKISFWFAFATLLLSTNTMANDDHCILKARYIAMEGTDIEHGQGAIERNELPHFPLEPVCWLIRVPGPGDPAEWERKLNASIDRKLGTFQVEPPSAEDLRRVEAGEVAFQQ